MQLEISAEEAAVLDNVLESALGDVREQIYKSEVAEYKTGLKEREKAIGSLLARLRARQAAPG
jgi:hypothetical protein